jgi:hypothetical protein
MTSSIDSDSRFNILGTGKDSLLERESMLILHVLIFLPDGLTQMLAEERFRACRKFRERNDILRLSKMSTTDCFRLRRGTSHFEFLLNHSFDAIVHVLDELDLTDSQSSFVRNVIDVIVGFSVLTMGSSNLYLELVCNLLEKAFLLAKIW